MVNRLTVYHTISNTESVRVFYGARYNAGLAITGTRVRIPLCYRFDVWAFSFSPLTPLFTQLYKEYLANVAIDSGGNVSDLVLARNCCMARMLPGEAEFVTE